MGCLPKRLESDYKKSLRKGTIDMKKHKVEEYEKLDMVRALISARIDYYQQKQGDKTFHQDIIEELECINSVVYAGLNSFLRKVVNETLDKE